MAYLVFGIAAFMAFTVLRIGKQIWDTYQCPDTGALLDFWYGRMDTKSQQYRNLITHLGHCEKCREALHQVPKGKPLEDHLVD